MNQHRKEIILKEIEYWKKNRLLPEQYCNYLLTLYSEGEHEEKSKRSKSVFNWSFIIPNIWFVLFLTTLLANYFTEMSFHLQIPLNIILLICSIGFSVYFSKKKDVYYKVFMILSFFIFFITTTEMVEFISPTNHILLGFIVIFNCLLWYLLGRKLMFTYLKWAGLIGFFLVILLLIKNLFFTL
ncbi:hypothetical protein [Bacillus pinisoli]|uniref:hypothetical protein n=1 Tax=Bacillus pinisoli TaxID=2901866 RepID=UPI001FF13D65|nr:hypothetical protein [Bacillus pinisoli]